MPFDTMAQGHHSLAARPHYKARPRNTRAPRHQEGGITMGLREVCTTLREIEKLGAITRAAQVFAEVRREGPTVQPLPDVAADRAS